MTYRHLRAVNPEKEHPRDIAHKAVKQHRKKKDPKPWCEVPNGPRLDVDEILRRSEPRQADNNEKDGRK